MLDINDFVNDLKGKECQWLVCSNETFIRFDASLKTVDENSGLDKVTFKFKGLKSMVVNINNPFSLSKNEDDEKILYSILKNHVPVMKVGFFKEVLAENDFN